MIVYVSRVAGPGSPINGVYTVAQENAQEAVDDSTPDVQAYLAPPRVSRTLLAIQTDINALTAAQKTAIGADLFGASQKWSTDVRQNAGSMFVLFMLSQLGLSAAQTTAIKIAGAAMYTQDNPSYLVHPAFDSTINIPGDTAG